MQSMDDKKAEEAKEEVTYEELKHAIEIFLESNYFSELQKAVYEAAKRHENIVRKTYFPDVE